MGKVVGPIFKFFFIALFMALLLRSSSSTIEEDVEREIDHWFQKLHYSKPKLTRLHFFFHDIVSGPAQTTVVVVPPANTTTYFGQVNIFDDALTERPEPTSKILGRAQGLYGFASQEDFSLLMAMTFVFTSGNHNGSSVTILGRNTVIQSPREFPIVGGTGNFRLARGFASASNYFANTSVVIVQYNVAIIHY